MNLPDPQALHNTYQTNKPFPHITFPDFFDEDLALLAEAEFDMVDNWRHHSHKHVANKQSMSKYEQLPIFCKEIVDTMNSPVFVKWLSKMTGYRNLIPDEEIHGGGLHMTTNGGFLDIHRDFNYQKLLKANRRLNAIVFLNSKYELDWGGELELHSHDFEAKKRIPAKFNNLVIFDTIGNHHGHPTPLAFPEGENRKSIALYYYQVGKPESDPHSTLYRKL
jgi:Rps23 Pro-64 3,4-dihydroxylase Tpa1-like proline 4-hydroxylase